MQHLQAEGRVVDQPFQRHDHLEHRRVSAAVPPAVEGGVTLHHLADQAQAQHRIARAQQAFRDGALPVADEHVLAANTPLVGLVRVGAAHLAVVVDRDVMLSPRPLALAFRKPTVDGRLVPAPARFAFQHALIEGRDGGLVFGFVGNDLDCHALESISVEVLRPPTCLRGVRGRLRIRRLAAFGRASARDSARIAPSGEYKRGGSGHASMPVKRVKRLRHELHRASQEVPDVSPDRPPRLRSQALSRPADLRSQALPGSTISI